MLFEPNEIGCALPCSDRRGQHILKVLRRVVGETFDAGIVNGARGKATLTALTEQTFTVAFQAMVEPQPAPPITLIVGLPRPQTARDILRDATTLGVGSLCFVRTEKGERSYAQSSLWSGGEWRRHVLAGAEQAFDPRLPDVTVGVSLAEALDGGRGVTAGPRIALDNYESAVPLRDVELTRGLPVTLAIGSERGWSAAERTALREHGFALAHLGSRVLRTETAVIVALALVRARLGLG